jgi:hypothetical protein
VDHVRRLGIQRTLTPELIYRLAERVRNGTPIELAAIRFERVAPSTYRRWWKLKGEIYELFRDMVTEAESDLNQKMMSLIMVGAVRDPKLAQWVLKYNFPEAYGDKQTVEVSGKDGKAIKVKTDRADPREAIAASLGPDAHRFLTQMYRWPRSAEELEAWRLRNPAPLRVVNGGRDQ